MSKRKVVRFTKMHGAGNDYVYIDATECIPANPEELARLVSDRHFGVGGDGLVLIMRSEIADFRMRMFNADGSEAEMCGNASRCIGKFVHDKGLASKNVLTLETLAGIKVLNLHIEDGTVKSVTVDMGTPELRPAMIPVVSRSKERMLSERVEVSARKYEITAVSMGNPHAVVFIDEDPSDGLVLGEGPDLECADIFPVRTNVEFARVIDRNTIKMRVWERGTGETLACGTGACATLVAAVLNGLTGREADLLLSGGTLHIEWREEDGHVYMTGPAEIVADGEYYLPDSCG